MDAVEVNTKEAAHDGKAEATLSVIKDGLQVAHVESYWCGVEFDIPGGWKEAHVHSLAWYYMKKYVLFGVVTAGADNYFRVDSMLCTWLSHVPRENLLFVTDNLHIVQDRPGRWIRGTTESTLMSNGLNVTLMTRMKSPAWLRKQLFTYDAFRELLSTSQVRPNIRWVVVIYDETFLILNALASMLHGQDLKQLYTEAVPEWRDTTDAARQRWRSTCETKIILDGNATALEECTVLPQKMRTVFEDALGVFPDVWNVSMMIHHISNIPLNMDGLAIRDRVMPRVVWNNSNALFTPYWVRNRLLGPSFLSHHPYRGAGQYISSAARTKYLETYEAECVERNTLLNGLSSEESLDLWLRHSGIPNGRDPRLCAGDGLIDENECVGVVKEKRLRQATMVSLYLRNIFRMPRQDTVHYLTLYYKALYQRLPTALKQLLAPEMVSRDLFFKRRAGRGTTEKQAEKTASRDKKPTE